MVVKDIVLHALFCSADYAAISRLQTDMVIWSHGAPVLKLISGFTTVLLDHKACVLPIRTSNYF